MGDTGVTWIQSVGSTGEWALQCRACRKFGQRNAWSTGVQTALKGNLRRHHNCPAHRESLVAMGLATEADELMGAPCRQSFKAMLQERAKGTALRHGVPAVGGKRKVTDMQLCLGQALEELDKGFLRNAAAVAVFQDLRKNFLLMRYQACNSNLDTRCGVLTYINVGALSGATSVLQATAAALDYFFTQPGSDEVDTQALQPFTAKVELYCADANKAEQLVGRELKPTGIFRNLKYVVKDRTHATQRLPA